MEWRQLDDALRKRVVVFGGVMSWGCCSQPQAVHADTTVYGATGAATASMIGAGCAGTSGVPQLVPSGLPALGRASFGLDVVGAQPGSLVILPFAPMSADIPVPGGCRVRVDPSTVFVAPYAVVAASGFVSVRIAVPAAPSLSGLVLYTQALIGEAAPPRLVMSAGLRLMVAD